MDEIQQITPYNLPQDQPQAGVDQSQVFDAIQNTLQNYRGRVNIGQGSASMHFEKSQGHWTGNDKWDLAPLRWDMEGNFYANSATIAGVALTTIGSFGGDGSSGALSITSGTTTIDLANAAVVVLNYTSISITGTGQLAFSNPHANGTIIYLKSQGAVVLTSSATPLIELTGIGAAGGAGAGGDGNGSVGSSGTLILDSSVHGGAGGINNGGGSGAGGVILSTATTNFYTTNATALARKMVVLACGSGGGGGAADSNGDAAGGGGGAGSVNSAGGSAGAPASTGAGAGALNQGAIFRAAGGGGGGSAGMGVILYATATATSGTISTSGGNSGRGMTDNVVLTGGDGGRGGGALVIECAGDLNFTGTIYCRGQAGNNATGSGTLGTAAQTGGASYGGVVAQNKYFA